MSTWGLWPDKPNQLLFFLTFAYFSYLMVLEYLDLLLNIDNFENVLLNLTENVAFTQILLKVLMLRLYNRQLGELISEANEDFDAKDYTAEEITAFVAYYFKAKIFVMLLSANTTLTATSFYIKPCLGQMSQSTL